LNAEIRLAASEQSVALGAAILGCIAAGREATGYASIGEAIAAMARVREDVVYRPEAAAVARYADLYALYRELGRNDGSVANVMRILRALGNAT
jgi:L-ribulokinase